MASLLNLSHLTEPLQIGAVALNGYPGILSNHKCTRQEVSANSVRVIGIWALAFQTRCIADVAHARTDTLCGSVAMDALISHMRVRRCLLGSVACEYVNFAGTFTPAQ
jgi:hypothetical protein